MTDFTRRYTQAYLLSALVLITVALTTPRALAFLPGLFGLGLCLYAYAAQREILWPPKTAAAFLGGIVLLVGAGALWAVYPQESAARAGKLIPLFGCGLLWIAASSAADPDARQTGVKILLLLYAAMAGLITVERTYGMPISHMLLDENVILIAEQRLNRSLVILALLLVPMLSLAARLSDDRRIVMAWRALVLIALGFALWYCRSQTAQLAVLVGLVFYAAFPVGKKYAWQALGIVIVVASLAAPFSIRFLDRYKDEFAANPVTLEASIPHRLEIWNFVSEKALERPLLGHGVEVTRHLESATWMDWMAATNVLHPHNATLQVWIELGLAGIVLLIALQLYILSCCRALPAAGAQRMALATYMAALCMANTGYGLWQGWQLGLFLVLAGLVRFAAKQGVIKA